MIYREATVWDAQGITRLWMEMQKEVHKEGESDNAQDSELFFINLIAKIKKPGYSVIVAQDESTIPIHPQDKEVGLVGFIMGNIYFAEYSTDTIGFCDKLYVCKPYRNKGVFEELVKRLYVSLEKYKPKVAEFATIYDPKLIKFWQRKGYRPSKVVFRKEVENG